MIHRLVFGALALLTTTLLSAPADAQQASPELRARAEAVAALIRGTGNPVEIFTPAFLAQVPPAQMQAIARQLVAQYGAVRGIDRIEVQSATVGVAHFDFERASVQMTLQLEPAAPHRLNGLLITGATLRDDSLDAVMAELRALPGQTSIAVARLNEGAPTPVAGIEPDRPLAIGSAFKLFILAELSRQVQAGERRWGDVVTLDRRSLPSGTLQTWPAGSPVTLHTLASLMISVSDNTATDMLLHTLGRENVERMMTTIGVADPARNRPILSTLEMFAIKTAPDAAVAAWRDAGEAERRRLLATTYGAIDPGRIDPLRFTGGPVHIAEVEWFASANDLVRTMDWLRGHGDDTARAILAINPALPPTTREGLSYIGFKGGSEAGVINLTWLVRGQSGVWHVVTGSWNNPAAAVDDARFHALMSRALQQLRAL